MQAFADPAMWPLSPIDHLKQNYLGKDLREIAGPAAILDIAVVRRNCNVMLHTADVLKVGFRAHVKTHKTTELTRLQVGEAPRSVEVVVSTIAEAEHIFPFLIDCKNQSRQVNLLYGIPPSSTCFARLQTLRAALGPSSLSFLIDHPAQLQHLKHAESSDPIPVFIKTDTGYHRAGIPPSTPLFEELLKAISNSSHVTLQGFYSHNSNCYSSNSPEEALAHLSQELSCIASAADVAHNLAAFAGSRFTLSVGATPTTTSAQNLLASNPRSKEATNLQRVIHKIQESHNVELHAGVYTTLDLQQIATHARPRPLPSSNTTTATAPTMTHNDIGFRILAEVLSLYPTRGPIPEALISAGTLALGREPCKDYPGWAVVAPDPWLSSPSRDQLVYDITQDEIDRRGWIVGKVSQEHGILSWEGRGKVGRELEVGQKVLLWPNHACIAGAGFGWFFVVDSEAAGEGAGVGCRVVDVWARCWGW